LEPTADRSKDSFLVMAPPPMLDPVDHVQKPRSFFMVWTSSSALHLIFIFACLFFTATSKPHLATQKLKVQTISLNKEHFIEDFSQPIPEPFPNEIASATQDVHIPVPQEEKSLIQEEKEHLITQDTPNSIENPSQHIEEKSNSSMPTVEEQPKKKELPKMAAPTKKPVSSKVQNKIKKDTGQKIIKNRDPANKQIKDQKIQPKKQAQATTPNTSLNTKKDDVKRKQLEERAKEEQERKALIESALSSLERSSTLASQKATVQGKGASKNGPSDPKKIGPLASEKGVIAAGSGSDNSSLLPHEQTYLDELIRRLKLKLKLPDYGEIKVKLTIAKTGRVLKLAIISSKSQNNRSYIEKTIPSIVFPPFGSSFGHEQEHTFLINLSNELRY
jgi:hypothetical protein